SFSEQAAWRRWSCGFLIRSDSRLCPEWSRRGLNPRYRQGATLRDREPSVAKEWARPACYHYTTAPTLVIVMRPRHPDHRKRRAKHPLYSPPPGTLARSPVAAWSSGEKRGRETERDRPFRGCRDRARYT